VSVSATQAARITQARSARTASSLPASHPISCPPAGCGGAPVLTRLLQAFKGRRVGPTNSWLAQPFAAVNIRAATADSDQSASQPASQPVSLPGCRPPTQPAHQAAQPFCPLSLPWLACRIRSGSEKKMYVEYCPNYISKGLGAVVFTVM